MQKKWDTQDHDLKIASQIVDNYLDLSENSLNAVWDVITHDAHQELHFSEIPDWVLELTDYFIKEYGDEQGIDVTRKVLTRWILKGQMIH